MIFYYRLYTKFYLSYIKNADYLLFEVTH